MSLEILATAASVGTFFVIAATAAAALIQLRHMRGNNQIAAAMAINQVTEGDEFQAARRFIYEDLGDKLQDIDYRRALARTGRVGRQMQFIGNYYELIGIFVKYGLLDESMACEMFSNEIVSDWRRMASAIAILQRGEHFGWENFEYMFMLCERWQTRFPHGKFPRARQRVRLEDVWLAEDEAAASPQGGATRRVDERT
jgi:hypothetical protein